MKYLPQDYYDACKALEEALDSFERGGTYKVLKRNSWMSLPIYVPMAICRKHIMRF